MPIARPDQSIQASRALPRTLLLTLALLLGASSGARADESPWLSQGRPSAQAHEALALLAEAPSHGLEPRDYGLDQLRQWAAQPDPAAQARLSQGLGEAMQRYLRDLHLGRLDPRQVHNNFEPPRRQDFDAAARLQQALAAHQLAGAVRAAAPQLPLYEELRQALAELRALGAHPAWAQPLPALPPVGRGRSTTAKLEPGQPWAGLPQLTQRLQALGDLGSNVPQQPQRYEGALVDAMRRFQQRHGLEADGVIGRASLAALEVTPAARAAQIALNLERLRWTPLTQARRMVVVNIPEFVLRAYELREDGSIEIRQRMRVIVGKALSTETPVFDEEMRFIEFSPYWNVPPSIARKETVPTLRRDPGYLAREDMEIVQADGRISQSASPALLAEVLAGQARIRQRPGPHNALGEIKFVFPNHDNIYLHHTPSVGLFARERRDFSHGCIRVEQPLALAQFVMQDMPAWNAERISQAMAAGQSQTVKLATPIPVLIAYGTALVAQGRPQFFADIYGHDRALEQALRQRKPAPPLAAMMKE